ncbi:hypothetical protein HGRIS_008019 [Hohenbuehelia grisea]|uniref:Uncharacterized protein n=1 Tax=Hohenbuehelia grisea TaxID=104357 RepID=A0ABR3J737_9AGAR
MKWSYRTEIDHFHKFVDVLTERGVDMSKAKISKAEAALWGIEQLAKVRKKEKELVDKGKKKVKEGAQKLVPRRSSGDNQWKLDILHGRHRSDEAEETSKENDEIEESPSKHPDKENEAALEGKPSNASQNARGEDGDMDSSAKSHQRASDDEADKETVTSPSQPEEGQPG